MGGKLMNPVGRRQLEQFPIAPRLDSLAGKKIGLLDNTKKNADLLLAGYARILKDKHGVAEVVSFRKISSSPGAPEEMLDALSQCDAVLNAYGDCGSCTSWCIHDGVTLERRGVPTATVNSDAFVVLGQMEAVSLGVPGLPIVMVPHPMGDVDAATVAQRASDTVDQVLQVLTIHRDELEARYTDLYISESDKFMRSGLVCEF